MTQLLLLGDSLIADFEWQPRMSLFEVENFGLPGATADDLLDMLPDIKDQTDMVDIIMVMIGTNDLLSDNYKFIHTLKEIVIQLRKNYPIAEILVSSLFPMNLPHFPDNTISSFNTHIEAITAQTGCCFLDTHTKFLKSDAIIFQNDGVHITDAAYEIWAHTLLEHIAFLIEND
jgi:lysophospholipase L1-like esterase